MAEGQGTPSQRTIDRIQTACHALLQVGLIAEAGDGRLTVNHDEISRLRKLASAVRS